MYDGVLIVRENDISLYNPKKCNCPNNYADDVDLDGYPDCYKCNFRCLKCDVDEDTLCTICWPSNTHFRVDVADDDECGCVSYNY